MRTKHVRLEDGLPRPSVERGPARPPQAVDQDLSICLGATLSVAPTDEPKLATLDRFPVGTTLQRYVLLEHLGEGAMGIVYAAYDYGLDRKVAVKLLREPRSSDSQRLRLRREAQALAKLSHPNVVGVHDIGSHGDQVFIAMEYVDGRTLRRWREEKRRSLREVLAVFRAAGEGLAAAHAAGLVHRDFKPDNVLIDRCGRARVGDFGLATMTHDSAEPTRPEGPAEHARAADGPSDVGQVLTRTGMIFGTPAYMALEQHLGKRGVDARADQFSFAVALYESVCGVNPFAAGTAAGIAENIMHGRIHKPRRRVPSWLVRALLPALSAEPPQRYASMSVLLDKLRDRHPSRVRTLTTVMAAAGVLFAAGGLFAMTRDGAQAHEVPAAASPCRDMQRTLDGVWDAARTRALEHAFRATGSPRADQAWARVRAELDAFAATWTEQRTQACEATHVHHEQSEQLLDLRIQCLDRRRADLRALGDELLVIDAERLELGIDLKRLQSLEGCDDAAGLAQEVQPPSPAARAEVDDLRERERHLRALLATGRAANAVPEGRALVADAARLGYRPVQAEALLTLAGLLWAHDDFSAMETTLVEAVTAAEAGRAHRLAAEALVELVWVVGEERGRYADAHRDAQLARAKLVGVGGDKRLEALLDDTEGVLWLRQKNLAKARSLIQRSHALYLKLYDPDSHQLSASLEHQGMLAQAERRYGDAAQLFRRAFQIAERVYGFEHSATLTYLAEEAKALAHAGHLDEAAAANQRGHELLADDDATGVMFLANLGLISWKRKQYDQARDYLTRSLAIIEKHRGADHPDVAEAAADLGRVLADLGRLPEATQQLTRAVATYERAFGPDHPDLAIALVQLARVHIAAGKRPLAVGSLERAIAILERSAVPRDEIEKARSLLDRHP